MYVRRSIICCQHYSTGMVTTVVQALSASVSTGTTTSTSLPPQQQELEQQPEQEQEVIDIDEDDDADSIDEDQLTEFREQLISLGSFPVRTSCENEMECPPDQTFCVILYYILTALLLMLHHTLSFSFSLG